MNKIIVILICMCGSMATYAQNTRNVEAPKPPTPTYQNVKKEKNFLNFLKNKKNRPKSREVAEFRDRMRDVYKQRKKREKLADKKRYKDPTYFGHKRKPKKRPPGKQKFCKVCGIKH